MIFSAAIRSSALVTSNRGRQTKTPPMSDIASKRAHAHRVVERHDAERSFAVAVLVLRDMRDRRGAFRNVAARHALGLCGRARRVEHDRPGIGAHSRRRLGGITLDHRLEWDLVILRHVERNALAGAWLRANSELDQRKRVSKTIAFASQSSTQ